ncbi:hypothetical protein Rhe02_05070 [Rhizocola hellebori]|uniref:Uncharacterized protein n=1 Tax=Rhizocola hellebori TaxID=1392758 RepID=A0A8J3VD70_9ACTN|nr:hypothetical protein [Rhizocola hellebori]GIH02440.1 hypothetical protein Rhe02_05070 [Rhizocola hellebori]
MSSSDADELLASTPADVVRLAEAVSLSARIDASFLRRARLQFLPQATAAAEAGLWFSALSQAHGRSAMSLVPEVAQRLRGLLSADPERMHRIQRFTAAAHDGAEPTILLMESLIWSGLTGEAIAPAQASAIGALIEAVLDDSAASDDLSRWLLCHLPALPEAIRRGGEVRLLESIAAQRLGEPLPAGPAPPGLAALSSRLLREIELGVTLRSDGVEISWPPEPGSQIISAAGRATVRLSLQTDLPHATGAPVQVVIRQGKTLLPWGVRQVMNARGHAEASSLCRLDRKLAAVSVTGTEVWVSEHGTVEICDEQGRSLDRLTLSGKGIPLAAFSADGSRVLMACGLEAVLFTTPSRRRKAVAQQAFSASSPVHAIAINARATAVALATDTRGELHRRGRNGWDKSWLSDGFDPRCLAFDRVGRLGGVSHIGQCTWGLQHGIPPWPDLAYRENNVITAAVGEPGWLAWASSDGGIAVCRAESVPRKLGLAPWQATSIALTQGEAPTVYVAGNDSFLLAFAVDALPRRIGIDFVGKHIAAHGDRLTVVGAGGPVRIECADGTGYVLRPASPFADFERDSWAKASLVIRDVMPLVSEPDIVLRAAMLAETLSPLRGAAALIGLSAPDNATQARFPSDLEMPAGLAHVGEMLTIVAALHSRGIRALVEVDCRYGDPVPALRRWLRTPIDGVVLLGGDSTLHSRIGRTVNRTEQIVLEAQTIQVRPAAGERWITAAAPVLRDMAAIVEPTLDATLTHCPADVALGPTDLLILLGLPGMVSVSAQAVARLARQDKQRLELALSVRANEITMKLATRVTVSSGAEIIEITHFLVGETVVCLASLTGAAHSPPDGYVIFPPEGHVQLSPNDPVVWCKRSGGEADA